MKSLASFSPKDAVKILQLFSEGGKLKKVGNKSGFLAGIMRRFTMEAKKSVHKEVIITPSSEIGMNTNNTSTITDSTDEGVTSTDTASEGITTEGEVLKGDVDVQGSCVTTSDVTGDVTSGSSSRRDRKKQEAAEIQAILEEEGALDEEEGKQADELEKLTGCPQADDVLLYAVPMCGPYGSML
eukprot:gene50566-67707_t